MPAVRRAHWTLGTVCPQVPYPPKGFDDWVEGFNVDGTGDICDRTGPFLPNVKRSLDSPKVRAVERAGNGPDEERYRRLRELGWDLELLGSSRVMVVGAGALGNEIIKNLALAGVGTLLAVDSDTIETHNLTRSVLFRATDVGRSKAEVAAQAAREIEPALNIRWFHSPIQHTLGLGVFRLADVVLGAVDNLQTRRDLNRACMFADTPFIDGGLFYLDGDVRTFLPPFHVCFDCTLTQDERDEGWRRWSCLKLSAESDFPVGPTAPTIASMVGGLQAKLALKYLHRTKDLPLYL